MEKNFEEKIADLPFYVSDEYKEFIKNYPKILQSNPNYYFEDHKNEIENRYGIDKHGFALCYDMINDLVLEDNDYIIRPFTSITEVIREGFICRNAIAIFMSRILHQMPNPDGYIFAMRSKDAPEKPFISMMFDTDGEIYDKQGMKEIVLPYNKIVEGEKELAFIKRFQEEVIRPFVSK